ncbi:MAG: hypothetical protein K6D02_05695 [Lachnospiraceae bacterium]|nr:hypothetical protein [Lachnospiraceae bacterium]
MKNNLSDNSIKEAFDNLNSGICFTDNSGRIVLINHVMNKLITELNGSAPQLLSDMKTEGLNVFSDGSSWEFHSAVLEGKEVQGFTKIIAQDVTEIYEVGERIKSENIHLRETNEELSKMYDILSDRIREEETLNLKMKVHNDIGRSLIALSEILENSESNIFNTENEMKKLRNAVSYFSNYKHEEGSKSLEEVKASAKELGITVYIEGDMPKDKHIEDAVTLAIAESVTNCYIHAKGSRVKVAISEKKVIITNDGITPSGEIKEGGGLSSLRKKLEKAGLLMKVYYKPEFKLEIIF